MYIDVSCHSRTQDDNDVREILFRGIKQKINGIALLPPFLLSIKDFVLEGMDLSCLVDFPYGSSDTQVRSHATLAAIRKGANTIDLAANNSLYFNSRSSQFFDDIETLYNLSREQNVTLRIVLEYRLFEPDRLIKLVQCIKEIGIEYVIPSTGVQMDSWEDNLLIAVEITKECGLNVITNGVITTRKQLDAVKKSGVFGVRFSSMSQFHTLIGV